LGRVNTARLWLPAGRVFQEAADAVAGYARRASRCATGIQLSEAITGGGAAIFRHPCWMNLEGIVSKRVGS